MIKATFTNSMIKQIKKMKGKTFLSYEGALNSNEMYGNVRLNTNEFSIELLNEVKDVPYFDYIEEISTFSCKQVSGNEHFTPFCDDPFQECLIYENITGIKLVSLP